MPVSASNRGEADGDNKSSNMEDVSSRDVMVVGWARHPVDQEIQFGRKMVASPKRDGEAERKRI